MTISEDVKRTYQRYHRFMREQVNFSLPDSRKHTQDHCARVLLFCLMLAEQLGLAQAETSVLAAAACFHDARRWDDGLDVGHGRRAAAYYRAYCEAHGMPFDKRAYGIMAYHDQDDARGIRALREDLPDAPETVQLYQIFKDADALDRFRLGPTALDVRYLRTDPAKAMTDFSKQLLRDGIENI